jgi:carboxyl-terminal processing protease
MRRSRGFLAASLAFAALTASASAQSAASKHDGSKYEADVRFACDEIAAKCKVLIQRKGIDWDAVTKRFCEDAKSVANDQDHCLLLSRLIARLNDGHAAVTAKDPGFAYPRPEGGEIVGCGMFWCRIGKKIHVKTVWRDAQSAGIEPGWEVLSVDGVPVEKWLDERIAKLRDLRGFSTENHAFFTACHAGLAEPAGTKREYEFKDTKGAKKKRTIVFTKGTYAPQGPAVWPEKLEGLEDLSFGLLPSGYGYLHIRRCKEDLPKLVDGALAKIGSAKGLIVDFRANGGGGFDHEDFLGHFVPKGGTLAFGQSYPSTGEHPYGGPIVVIVDGTTFSAGETGAGIFKEDGRAYMIGESPTAGASSQKAEIELPSGLFTLRVSVESNKLRFNGGKGIEGVGVIPHEVVAYDAKDLAKGVDTLIARAEELLKKFPKDKVPYKAP